MGHWEKPDSRKVTNKILDAIKDGALDRDTVINACLSYMSEADVEDMADSNYFFESEEEEEEEEEGPEQGERGACKHCDQDIEWNGDSWNDRGGNTKCVPTHAKGSALRAAHGGEHEPNE